MFRVSAVPSYGTDDCSNELNLGAGHPGGSKFCIFKSKAKLSSGVIKRLGDRRRLRPGREAVKFALHLCEGIDGDLHICERKTDPIVTPGNMRSDEVRATCAEKCDFLTAVGTAVYDGGFLPIRCGLLKYGIWNTNGRHERVMDDKGQAIRAEGQGPGHSMVGTAG